MRVLARGGPVAVVLVFVSLGACLVPNPAFVDTSLDESDENGSCSPDEREPDDDENTAAALGLLNDDAPVLAIEGTLEDATAQDWFTFEGHATSGLVPQPRARATTDADEGVSVCVFVECAGGTSMTD